jgi:hypothetical protein
MSVDAVSGITLLVEARIGYGGGSLGITEPKRHPGFSIL